MLRPPAAPARASRYLLRPPPALKRVLETWEVGSATSSGAHERTARSPVQVGGRGAPRDRGRRVPPDPRVAVRGVSLPEPLLGVGVKGEANPPGTTCVRRVWRTSRLPRSRIALGARPAISPLPDRSNAVLVSGTRAQPWADEPSRVGRDDGGLRRRIGARVGGGACPTGPVQDSGRRLTLSPSHAWGPHPRPGNRWPSRPRGRARTRTEEIDRVHSLTRNER